ASNEAGSERAALTEAEARSSAATARIADLEARLAALPEPSPAPDLSPLQDRIAALETGLADLEAAPATEATPDADLSARLDRLETQIATLEARPTGEGTPSSEAEEARAAELARLRAQIEAAAADALTRVASAEAEMAVLREQADGIVASAGAAVALTRLRAALETGGPYADAMDALGRALAEPVPEALAAHAATGVESLPRLRDAFPEAAREGLRASLRATVGDDMAARMGTFLRNQVGARSIEPREGDDPDALLSRAEARLATGDLAGALALIEALPEAGQEAMAGWIASARARMEAVSALDALTAATDF
ncbi:MAG: hypothetical protein JJU40_02740, partial [Rhodobacteraceae bacterium]|nr:hypothetical protein [Paracoccaceae bacterium]